MRLTHFMTFIALLMPVSAAAFDAKGTGTGTSMNEAVPIHDGLVLVKVSSMYDGFETDMADNALATAKGPCFGTMIIDKGAVSGGGACNYTDADGEAIVISWTPSGFHDEGRTLGTWEVIGGTGKWMEASGGGDFNAGGEGDDYTNIVTGEVNLN